jgi:hypothetical protein
MSRRRLDDALARIEARESLCREPLYAQGVALSLLQKAMLFGSIMKQTRLGLDFVERAERLAFENALDDIKAKAEKVRESILAAVL